MMEGNRDPSWEVMGVQHEGDGGAPWEVIGVQHEARYERVAWG